MRNGLIARKAKVLRCPNFALILDFLSVTVWAKKKKKKKIENTVLIQSYMYDFVTKFEKGVFRAHCTQIWGTSKLAFNRYM